MTSALKSARSSNVALGRLVVTGTARRISQRAGDAVKAVAAEARGRVLEDADGFSGTAVVEVPRDAAGPVSTKLGAIEGLAVVDLGALALRDAGLGSGRPAEILRGLERGPLDQRLAVADALVERLREQGPEFLAEAERDQLAWALFQLAEPLSQAFDALSSSEPPVDWLALRPRARAARPPPEPEVATLGLRGQVQVLAEALSSLDSTLAAVLLERLMPLAADAGTDYLLGHPPAAQALFSRWLAAAQSRIDQADFSRPPDWKAEEQGHWRRGVSSGGYETLSGRRKSYSLYQLSPRDPFDAPSIAPVVLLTGPRGPALATQFAQFVALNADKVDQQARARESTQAGQVRRRLEPKVSPEALEAMVADELESDREGDAMQGNGSLDVMVDSLRDGARALSSATDLQHYCEAVLPLYGQLLERVKSPLLLPLIIDGALATLQIASARRADFGDPTRVDQACVALERRLGPFVQLAEALARSAAETAALPQLTYAQQLELSDVLQQASAALQRL